MADENNLDAFFSSENTNNTAEQPVSQGGTVSLEDEFAKLLNDFINQDNYSANNSAAEQKTNEQPNLTQAANSGLENLDSFVTPETQETSSSSQETGTLDTFLDNPTVKAAIGTEENSDNGLKPEEKELDRALSNFQDGINALADKKNFKIPHIDYNETMLLPNYKPSVGKKIAQYLLSCWDIINKCDPENMKRLPANAGDEEYLTFAESLSDTDMQLVIISYVEILINLEICEVSYSQKKELLIKNRIKKELYDEYMELQKRKNLFIKKLKEKNFPINVEQLINNYFHAAQKDPEGSFEALTKNPAMYAPIDFDKMHARFFGLIKVTPEDGIKANQKIGAFIKKLKV